MRRREESLMATPTNTRKSYRPGKFHPWRAEIALSKEGQKRLAERRLRELLEKIEAREVNDE